MTDTPTTCKGCHFFEVDQDDDLCDTCAASERQRRAELVPIILMWAAVILMGWAAVWGILL